MSPEPWTENDNNVEQDKFCIGDNPCIVLDQYLDGEELKELILEEGNVFNKTAQIDVFDVFNLKKNKKH